MRNTIETGAPYQSKCTQKCLGIVKVEKNKQSKTKTGADFETVQSNAKLN